jgi:hypothetical protein
MEGVQLLDKVSYRVAILEGDKNVVVEARIPLGTVETLSDPEKRIRERFATSPLPETNTVIDI